MSTYSIGIDTGGTYTDAVLLNNQTKEMVAWRKERTTSHDLSIGVGTALAGLLQAGVNTAEITCLAVSTTLATNAVVENRGARVALFVLGTVRPFRLPVVANIYLKGGHTITGQEDEPLDLERLVDTLPGLITEVDSYAVCGTMSIKNPTHELVVREAIRLIDPKPVFCSHLVSTHSGVLERSATACLHARLMPLMTEFLDSIQRSMTTTGLNCPVIMICGNGRGEALEHIADRAAITMASGPAATACFGTTSGLRSALVVDVGGTTTDVCLIKDGQPLLSKDGCTIGQWQTHVEAVDMYTAGIGGDTHVLCGPDRTVSLTTTRVHPLAMTMDLPDPGQWLTGGDDTLVLPVKGLSRELIAQDVLLSFLATHGSATPRTLADQTGIRGILLEKRLERLLFLQHITVAGFTPTDALHALGLLQIGNAGVSRQAARLLGGTVGTDTTDFCRRVIEKTETAIEKAILTYLARSIWVEGNSAHFLNRLDNDLFSVRFELKLPIIAIGAAARCFLPNVAARLGTTATFPKHYEVGNAIGAALIGSAESVQA